MNNPFEVLLQFLSSVPTYAAWKMGVPETWAWIFVLGYWIGVTAVFVWLLRLKTRARFRFTAVLLWAAFLLTAHSIFKSKFESEFLGSELGRSFERILADVKKEIRD